MARIRSIKPEFPHSESMGRVSRDARLCFIQMWTLSDDAGRIRGASRMLASLLFPYDDDAPELIGGWLDELEDECCILRYAVDGKQYVQVTNWGAHQKIDKPSESKFPPPPDNSAVPPEDSRGSIEGSENVREDSREGREASISRAHLLGKEGKGIGREPSRGSATNDELSEPWSEFADIMPTRSGNSKRHLAQAEFKRLVRSGESLADILAGARRYRLYCDGGGATEPRFIESLLSFLTGRSWVEKWDIPPPKRTNGSSAQSAFEGHERTEEERRRAVDGVSSGS